jgi:hypothetical protein
MDKPVLSHTGSMMLWLLASAVALASSFVAHGWMRQVHRAPVPSKAWGGQLLAALALGTGLCASFVIELASQGLRFAVGYQTTAAALLWVEGDSVAILHEGQLTRGTGSRIAGFIKRRSERPPPSVTASRLGKDSSLIITNP